MRLNHSFTGETMIQVLLDNVPHGLQKYTNLISQHVLLCTRISFSKRNISNFFRRYLTIITWSLDLYAIILLGKSLLYILHEYFPG